MLIVFTQINDEIVKKLREIGVEESRVRGR